MPLYEYECPKDGTFERIQKFADPPLTACPTCGGPVEKLLSAPAIQFKGTGWYITDYARKGDSGSKKDGDKAGGGSESGKDSSAASASSDSKASGSSSSGSGKSSSGSDKSSGGSDKSSGGSDKSSGGSEKSSSGSEKK